MKLSPLLAKYLHEHKELKLTGIGRFYIESSMLPDTEGRQMKSHGIPSIQFDYDPSTREDSDLIHFISSQTGKMKSLVAADVDSHLELVRQFLNIGKPFHFEGIGTLTKQKSGIFGFSQELPPSENKESHRKDKDLTSSTEDSFSEYEEMFSPKKPGLPLRRKLTVAIAILSGLALAVWGGYYVYKKTTNPAVQTGKKNLETKPVPDTVTTIKDSIDLAPIANIPDPGTFKFIIEISPRERALYRFETLKGYGLDIRMETADSIQYKLYFQLTSTPADTLRIRDSLSLLYVNPWYMKNGKVIIE